MLDVQQALVGVLYQQSTGLCVVKTQRQRERETMKNFAKTIRHFLVSEDGPTAVEYAVMLALIVIVCLTAVQQVGHETNHIFDNVSKAFK